tara:strand:+ start:5898 stop:6149 length:252 start_codon:yes stop_codon:yes gene_type:complete
MSNVEIVSDGTAIGTKVYVDGEYIEGLTKIEILPIKPNGIVSAVLTIDKVSLNMRPASTDINVTDMLLEEQIRTELLGNNQKN